MAKRRRTNDEVRYGEASVMRGAGRETHQPVAPGIPSLTTQQGTPVADDQNSLKVGARGPTLLEDFHFREKIFHFDHERIPERVVHARGFGAHGFFENYEPLTAVTKADPFQRAKQRTPAFVRFSTVAGNKGSSDLARDAVALLVTEETAAALCNHMAAVEFVSDAYAYCKYIAFVSGALPLLQRCNVPAGEEGRTIPRRRRRN
jgi:catalase